MKIYGDLFKETFSRIYDNIRTTKVIRFLTKYISRFSNFYARITHKGELKNHILIRYLLRDLFLYFFVSFLFFFMIFFVNQILLTAEKLLSKSAPFADVVRIMFYSLPFIIAQSAPFATLVGFLMSLGGMMSNNEVLIFRAAGFSFIKIFIPTIILGIAISIGSFFVNDYLLPLGSIKYNQLMRKISNSTPTIELESNSVKKLGSSQIVIGNVTDSQVSDLILFDTKDGKERMIFAGESSLQGSSYNGVLLELNMNDSLVFSVDRYKVGDYDIISSDKTTLNIFDSVIMGNTMQSAQEMTSYDLSKTIKEMRIDVQENPNLKQKLNVWVMEYHKKFSLPFASIFFAFLAFSIAFLVGKHNGQTIGLLVGIVICVLYWAMQIMGQLFVVRIGLNSFWCIWVPNILIGLISIILSIRLIKK
ncbi:MAG: LptF/LptG family permease [Spirochaetales bacterium]|nr:LptF/LptG family permease [Spirochaetales bacterium]